MDGIESALRSADEHLKEADAEIQVAREEIEEIVTDNSQFSVERTNFKEVIEVSVDYSETIARLNDELPIPFLARETPSGIEIRRIEVDDDIASALGVNDRQKSITNMKDLIAALETVHDTGAPLDLVMGFAVKEGGLNRDKAEDRIETLNKNPFQPDNHALESQFGSLPHHNRL